MTHFFDSLLQRLRHPAFARLLSCVSVMVLLSVTAAAQETPAQESNPTGKRAPSQAGLPIFTEEREAAALTFVRNNRPELLKMLEELKVSNAEEYQRAMRDLFRTSERLASIKQEDPVRYESALKEWHAEAHAHLLVARLMHQQGDADQINGELKQTVEKLIDTQLEQRAEHVRRMEAGLEQARRQHEEFKNRRDEIVQQRLDGLLRIVKQQHSGTQAAHHGGPQDEASRRLEELLGQPYIVFRKRMHDELKLSDEQRQKLGQVLDERSKEAMQLFDKLNGLKPEERRKQVGEYRAKAQESLAEFLNTILNEEQLQRLRQLELRQQGISALVQPKVLEELKITDEQRKQFAAISQSLHKETEALTQAGGSREETRPKILQIRKEHEDKMEAVLDDAQRKKWQQMLGTPLEPGARP